MNKLLLAVTYAKLRLGSKEANLAAIVQMIDDTAAGCLKEHGRTPDMMLFSESIYSRGNKKGEQFEETGGPLMRIMAAKARQYNCWMVFNWYEHRTSDGRKYNSNTMMNRAGDAVASYDKTFITPDDIRLGCTAGSKEDVKPIDTEFGPIGMLICYDVDARNGERPGELIALQAERGAKLVLISTIGDYALDTRTAGTEAKVWTAHCGQDSYKKSGLCVCNITDPEGDCVAGTAVQQLPEPTFCSAEINL
jgi:predicted amidohydrolase